MGLPRNCHYHSILIECNLPDVPELVHKCSLQVYRRLKKLPADHSVHEVFRNEGFLWKNDIPKMYSIITKHVINAIQKTQLLGDLRSWTFDHIAHDMLSAKKLNRLVNTLSFYRWRQEDHCKPLQSLLRFGCQGVSAYLKYDPFKVVKQRARLRQGRTKLLADRRYHHEELKDVHCTSCAARPSAIESQQHFLFNCDNPRLKNARMKCIDNLYFPSRIPSHDIDMDRCIIVFTDGSFIRDDHRKSGAGALVCFPQLPTMMVGTAGLWI